MIDENQMMHLLSNPGDTLSNYAISMNFNIDTKKRKIIDKRDKSELDYNIDAKIMVYEDRQFEWFFNVAKRLTTDNEAGFVILMIASSYIESNQQYREGTASTKKSEEFFKKAAKRIFPGIAEENILLLYKEVRCGFFHDGITRKTIFITGSQKEIFRKDGENLIINPHLFLDRIISDFKEYMIILKDVSNKDLRNKFETFWDGFKGI
jgi:hypothetical protein